MGKTYTILAWPGDGIGNEVLPAAKAAVDAVAKTHGFAVTWQDVDWGIAHHRKHGRVMPTDYQQVAKTTDAILLGAVGWPAELPDHETLRPLIGFRQGFDQYACVRPVKTFAGVPSPLNLPEGKTIDLVVVRENSEGEYVNIGGRLAAGTDREQALQTAVHTRRGITRIVKYACELAMTRGKHLTLATKSNALAHAFTLWEEITAEVVKDYPELTTDKRHCDALAMDLVRKPWEFDVIVASNLFGDILTDLAAVIGGGLGLAPSANINPERAFPSLFEPVHGSAPDIAGQGIANPTAMILSAAMMLDHLGERQAGDTIRAAVDSALTKVRTTDLGGTAKASDLTAAIVAACGR